MHQTSLFKISLRIQRSRVGMMNVYKMFSLDRAVVSLELQHIPFECWLMSMLCMKVV